VESAIFLFTRRVLAFFRVNPAKSFNRPDFSYPERLFCFIIGSISGEPGETGKGGRKKNQKFGEFSFRGILQPTTGHRLPGTQRPQKLWLAAWVWFSLAKECLVVVVVIVVVAAAATVVCRSQFIHTQG